MTGNRPLRRGTVAVAWLWAALATVGAVVVAVYSATQGVLTVDIWGLLFVVILYVSLGLLVVIRQPGNRVSWLLYVVGTWIVLEGAAALRIDGKPDPVSAWDILAVIWANTGYFVALIIPLFLLFYIFPTGRFLNRRWSWAAWVAGLSTILAILAEGFAKEMGPDGEAWTIANPVGFLDSGGLGDESLLTLAFGNGLIALMIGAIPAIVIRYRRSAADVRSQIKWVVYSLVLIAVSFTYSIFIQFESSLVTDILFFLPLAILPVSITIAVIRYRLFEIDKLISRTVGYLIVVTLLGLVYTIGAVWLPTRVFGDESPLFVAGSTLVVAALFNPLRKKIQSGVDRRFNRSGYQAELIAERIVTELQGARSVAEVAEVWNNTVTEALQPSRTGVWING